MNILVTGGAGFIGSHFILYQREQHPDDRLVCLDSLTYAGDIRRLGSALADITFLKGDITDQETVFTLFQKENFDIVVNFAAESHVDRGITDPGVFLKTNILGTQVLMDACLAFRTGRFHQVSTDEVYGDLPTDKSDLLFREDMPLKPSSPYSVSKAAADLLVLAYGRTYRLDATITRSANNYGPFQHPEKLIPRMISRALAGARLPVYGKGDNIRSWLYVKDHCEAIDIVMRKSVAGEIYNIGGNMKTNMVVVKMILDAIGCPENLIEHIADRPGHDRQYASDDSKLRERFGWQPKTEYREGLLKTISWYIDHKEWWEPLSD